MIFAHNSDFNYVTQADLAAGLVRKNLGVPTTLVSDAESVDGIELQHISDVILVDAPTDNVRTFRLPEGELRSVWKNGTRHLAYELSPYDQTLLLDSDLMLFSSRLAHVFDTEHDLLCFDRAQDITGQNVFASDRYIGKRSIPMIWATAVYFTKGEFAKSVFDFVKLIRENYRYYSLLYGFSARPYRNDFAFSIALHTLAGYGRRGYSFPWALATLTSNAEVLELRPDHGQLVFGYQTDRYRISRIQGQDIHIMNKQVFNNTKFRDAVLEIINAQD